MSRRLQIEIAKRSAWHPLDQRAWEAATQKQGLFEASTKLSRVKSDRLPVVEAAFGRWVGFLSQSGLDTLGTSAIDLVEDTGLVRSFFRALDDVALCTARGYLTDLLMVCRSLNSSYCFDALAKVTRHAWQTAKPKTDKRARMVTARQLYELGLKLMDEAGECRTVYQATAQFRDGLMIAMLTSIPVRLGNFISIELDRHIVKLDDHYRLNFDRAEVKKGGLVDAPLPTGLTGYIDDWLALYRPRCLGWHGRWHREHDARRFWISNDGAPFTSGSRVRERLVKQTEMAFQKSINPHLYRAIVATTVSIEMPAEARIIRSLLGHRSFHTAEKHYIRADSVRAATALQNVLTGIRSRAAHASREESE